MSKAGLDVPEESDQEPADEEQGTATAISFFTAARIARWMAKAYGYLEKKKETYKSSQLVMSSWDIRGFTLEANMDKLEDKNKCSASVDTEPCTGDQLADSEKMVKWMARAYGLRDAAYHEAYNIELHRQARRVMWP